MPQPSFAWPIDLATLRRFAWSTCPAQWCQAAFILASCAVLGVALLPPPARAMLMDYGARVAKPETKDGVSRGHDDKEHRRHGDPWLRSLARLTSGAQVPHAWFASFYVVSLAGSLFWLAQYAAGGGVLRFFVQWQSAAAAAAAPPPPPPPRRTPSMTLAQAAIGWTMVVLQAGRRLYEHTVLARPSTSTMSFAHWLLGIFFYAGLSMAVWIDASEAMLHPSPDPAELQVVPETKMIGGCLGFLLGWIGQFRCHQYLFGLKKYSLPNKGLFRILVCPHYTCESLMYLSLALLCAPQGALYNKTLLSVLLFVLVNLGCTAAGTRRWYVARFGPGPLADKWNMIPYIF